MKKPVRWWPRGGEIRICKPMAACPLADEVGLVVHERQESRALHKHCVQCCGLAPGTESMRKRSEE